jgi:hypothetical protein
MILNCGCGHGYAANLDIEDKCSCNFDFDGVMEASKTFIFSPQFITMVSSFLNFQNLRYP